jgi:hypothetical protein
MEEPTIAQEDLTRAEEFKKKLYNADKSRKSYTKRKDAIARRRALLRLEKGQIINPTTIKDTVITDDDKLLIGELHNKVKEHMFVPERTPEFIQYYQERISNESLDRYSLLAEDTESEGYITTLRQSKNKFFSIQDGFDMIDLLIQHEKLMKPMIKPNARLTDPKRTNKSDTQKKIAIRNYRSKLHTIMGVYGTNNLYDVYSHPERFLNKLMTSHISIGSVAGYVSLLLTFYKYSNTPYCINIQNIIHIDKITKLSLHMKSGVDLSKRQEVLRLETEPYYVWEDFKKIVHVIKDHPLAQTVQGLRDQVISTMYMKENVLRDNLGMIKVVERNLPEEDPSNYLNLKTGFMRLKDFKTSTSFSQVKFYISQSTLILIREYLYAVELYNLPYTSRKYMRSIYLIMKNDGTLYKDGKLSNYITQMFERYTGAKNVSINDIRHSLATHHRKSDYSTKRMIANMMHHSFRQHELYEREHDTHLTFPVLENDQKYNNLEPYIGEQVSVKNVLYNKKRQELPIIGTVVSKIKDTENMYLIAFNHPKVMDAKYTLPDDNVTIW